MGTAARLDLRRSNENGYSDSTSPNIEMAKRDNQPPIHQPNGASRTREYLTPDEVERMITAARHTDGCLAERDALLIMMAYRHGLRSSPHTEAKGCHRRKV
jgi:integrase